jgi:hypothetical protein
MEYVNRPIGLGKPVPGPLKPLEVSLVGLLHIC